jgi:cytochrome b
MEAAAVSRSQWTFAQWGIVVLAVVQLAWAVAGLLAEPSFHFGDGAPSERVLGVDFNGVHALSGLLLFGPAFFFALRPRWAVLYAIYVAVALIVTGLWAIWSTSPAGIFTFPNNDADAILHISTGVLFAIVAAIQLGLDRR